VLKIYIYVFFVFILVLFINVNEESSLVQYGIVMIDTMLFTEKAEKCLFRPVSHYCNFNCAYR
jgi:hypothetical protein